MLSWQVSVSCAHHLDKPCEACCSRCILPTAALDATHAVSEVHLLRIDGTFQQQQQWLPADGAHSQLGGLASSQLPRCMLPAICLGAISWQPFPSSLEHTSASLLCMANVPHALQNLG